MRGGVAFFCLGAVVAALAGCDTYSSNQNTISNKPDVFDYVRSVDLTPRTPETGQVGIAGGGRAPRASSYYGDPSPVQSATPTSAGGDGYELNFDNAPVTTVAKVILGDILGSGYTIDPRVQGTVSLASGQPVQKGDLLFVLESALRLSNVAMVKDTTGYRLLPLTDAVGSGRVDNGPRGSRASASPSCRCNTFRGDSDQAARQFRDEARHGARRCRTQHPDRSRAPPRNAPPRVETVLSFDADWMRGQSVGIYPVHNATPEPMIAELEKIMDAAEGGPAQNLVKFQPSPGSMPSWWSARAPLLRTAATWITRLDKSDTASSGVKVYQVKYGDARQLAGLLNGYLQRARAAAASIHP